MKVTIYTTQTCKYCKEAKQFFNDHDIQFNEIDVGTDPVQREKLKEKTGMATVPVIVIGKKGVVGFDKEKIAKLLNLSL